MALNRPTSKIDPRILAMVVTVPEIVRMWGFTRKSVDMAILTKRITARRTVTDHGYLVLTGSVIELWGEPHETCQEWIDLKALVMTL